MNENKARILVVDDEPEMCWILATIIRKSGFRAMTALNAVEAIALIENNDFGMAFLDSKLPDIDGLELARQFRKLDAHLPIIIVSGFYYQDDLTIDEALRFGVINAFVSKPFNHADIVKAITRYATLLDRQTDNELPPFTEWIP